MLAFSIAILLDMPRPYWAMASVYITSNQFTGATRSKAVYRILGTLIGAAGTIVLVPNLEALNLKEAMVYKDPVSSSFAVMGLGYGVLYAAAVVFFATAVFSRRDLR